MSQQLKSIYIRLKRWGWDTVLVERDDKLWLELWLGADEDRRAYKVQVTTEPILTTDESCGAWVTWECKIPMAKSLMHAEAVVHFINGVNRNYEAPCFFYAPEENQVYYRQCFPCGKTLSLDDEVLQALVGQVLFAVDSIVPELDENSRLAQGVLPSITS